MAMVLIFFPLKSNSKQLSTILNLVRAVHDFIKKRLIRFARW